MAEKEIRITVPILICANTHLNQLYKIHLYSMSALPTGDLFNTGNRGGNSFLRPTTVDNN